MKQIHEYHAEKFFFDLKFLEAAQAEPPFRANACTADRDGANDVCEDALYFERPEIPRLRLPCGAHIGSTSQGRVYASATNDISGVIASSLAMQIGGEIEKLQHALVQLLGDRLRVHEMDAPGNTVWAQRRDDVLSLLLGGEGRK